MQTTPRRPTSLSTSDLIAVADIGKTKAKLLVVDPAAGAVVWYTERAVSPTIGTLGRALDVASIEDWLLEGLAAAPEKSRIGAILPIAHGAAAVLVDADGTVVAAPDYEDPAFETVANDYREVRDDYRLTFSPFLPLGLNLGRQLFFMETRAPDLWQRARALLLYPQYWAWRLCGVMASEVSSLGCHSDLWRPLEARHSRLAEARGWQRVMPPLRPAGEVLANIRPDVAAATGLDPACRTLCGLHDSNAGYLCHRADRGSAAPFAVVSSGTWTIVMAHGTPVDRLRESRDMLANVDVFGEATPTARFMGGREYAAIAASDSPAQPTVPVLHDLLGRGALALPSFATAGGAFAAGSGRLVNADGLDAAARATLATLYVALLTDLVIEWLGLTGDVIVDGPLATNPVFGPVLATLAPHLGVRLSGQRAGAAAAACHLLGQGQTVETQPVVPIALPALGEYRMTWRRALPAV